MNEILQLIEKHWMMFTFLFPEVAFFVAYATDSFQWMAIAGLWSMFSSWLSDRPSRAWLQERLWEIEHRVTNQLSNIENRVNKR